MFSNPCTTMLLKPTANCLLIRQPITYTTWISTVMLFHQRTCYDSQKDLHAWFSYMLHYQLVKSEHFHVLLTAFTLTFVYLITLLRVVDHKGLEVSGSCVIRAHHTTTHCIPFLPLVLNHLESAEGMLIPLLIFGSDID